MNKLSIALDVLIIVLDIIVIALILPTLRKK